jgi:hypothetical protein
MLSPDENRELIDQILSLYPRVSLILMGNKLFGWVSAPFASRVSMTIVPNQEMAKYLCFYRSCSLRYI